MDANICLGGASLTLSGVLPFDSHMSCMYPHAAPPTSIWNGLLHDLQKGLRQSMMGSLLLNRLFPLGAKASCYLASAVKHCYIRYHVP